MSSKKREDLTREEIIAAGSRSSNPAVKKAYEKLKFSLLMSHEKEDLYYLSKIPNYHIRIGVPTEDSYLHIKVRWSGEAYTIFAGKEGTVGQKAPTIEDCPDDPGIVYLTKTETGIAFNKG